VIKLEYQAWASPLAVGMTWGLIGTHTAPVWVGVACGLLVVFTSTIPGLVDPRYKGRMHPFAALVRYSAHLGHLLRAPTDRDRLDLSRGPTYCIEWCLLAGLVFALVLLKIPFIATGEAWLLGAAVTIGTASHFLTDLQTSVGVPVSAVYNWVFHGDPWRRHSLGWFDTDDATQGKFYAVPVLFFVSSVMGLAMLGVLNPLMTLLVG
jgi:hypothetical protein